MTITNFPIGDFLIRMKNTAMAGKREVAVPANKVIKNLADVLKKKGYLEKVEAKKDEIQVSVAYRRKKPVLIDLKLVSKPGLRIYMGVDDLKSRKKGASTLILSTPGGILMLADAIKKNVGGEVIAEVW